MFDSATSDEPASANLDPSAAMPGPAVASTDLPSAGALTDSVIRDLLLAFASVRLESTRAIQALCARFGVSPSDYRALLFVKGHAEPTPKRTAEHLGLTTGAMTSLLDRLESAQVLRRRPHPRDRRSLLLELTERGHSIVDQAEVVLAAAVVGAVDHGDRETVTRAFLALAAEFQNAVETVRPAD